MADCPHGSDEAGCSCADLDMPECTVNGAILCIFDEWIKNNGMIIPVCQNKVNRSNENDLVKWKYVGRF